MSSLGKILLHFVFSTKNRTNLIPSNQLAQLHAYIAGSLRNHESQAFRVGGTENHIHIACTLPRTITTAKLMEEIKRSSSKWMKQFEPDFSWQDGYGVFSVSHSQLEKLIGYIDRQAEHHKQFSFIDELKLMCDRYGVSFEDTHIMR